MSPHLSRRNFLVGAGMAATAVVAAGCGSSSSDSTTPIGEDIPDIDEVTGPPALAGAAVGHFAALGYASLDPLPLVTGSEFNGGLRYDGSVEGPAEKGMWVQACARTEDAGSSDVGTLALFHQLVVHDDDPEVSSDEVFDAGGGLLTDTFGLDPSRLGVVSTELVDPLRGALTAIGVPEDQIVQRQLDEALAAGDGSGYFNPEGHPAGPELLTASFHYRLDDDAEPLAHPAAEGWIELGEVSLNEGPQADTPTSVWGFGLERLELATTGSTSSYQQSATALAAAVDAEVSSGADRPPGADAF